MAEGIGRLVDAFPTAGNVVEAAAVMAHWADGAAGRVRRSQIGELPLDRSCEGDHSEGPGAMCFMSESERTRVRDQVRAYTVDAADNYNLAIKDRQDRVRAAAKARADLLGLIIDVALGPAGPLLQKAVGKAAGLAEKTAARFAADQAVSTALRIGTTQAKAAAGGISRAAGSEEFLEQVRVAASIGFRVIGEQISAAGDDELLTWRDTLATEKISKAAYLGAIDQLLGAFQTQVQPIREELPLDYGRTLRAARIDDRLALIQRWDMSMDGESVVYTFLRWIDDSMTEVAIARTAASGYAVEDLRASDASWEREALHNSASHLYDARAASPGEDS